ncbi:MAG: glycoside hydrolase family 43 protein [Bacteroidaceae bacterium]|nr:glycoside hydrolase family 43 protein [Bacteroidaceae bacterium]
MNYKSISLMLCLMASCVLTGCIGCSYEKKIESFLESEDYNFSWSNPLPLKFGDPFLLHASDGKYYMYGTSLEDGFEAYVSDSLSDWVPCGKVYQGGQTDQWNVNCFWAPEVYERDGRYYMFFSANYKENPTNEGENFKIGVAVSDSPTGPFEDLYDRPIFNPEYPIIDANVYFDDETGKCYLYFSRCCYKHSVESEIADSLKKAGVYDNIEESWVYGVEMEPDFSGVIGEPQLLLCPPKKLNDAQAEWESRSATHKEVNRRWTEGSYIFREGDTYYIMYSANHYGGEYYAVGYATSKSPLGPFKKAANNPVLQKHGDVLGTGHCMVITLPDEERYCVYHGRMTDNPAERVVLISPLEINDDGVLTVKQGVTKFHKQKTLSFDVDDDEDNDEEEMEVDEEDEEEDDFDIEDEE